MATIDDKLLNVLGQIEEHLRGNSKGTNGSFTSHNTKLSYTDYVNKLEREFNENHSYFSELYSYNRRLERLREIEEEIKKTTDEAEKKRLESEKYNLKSETYGKNRVSETIKGIEKIVEGTKKVYGVVQKLTKPWADADHAASKFTKTIGGTKKAMDALTKDTLKGVSKGIGLKFDLSSQELIEAQQNYLKGIGRNVNIDNIAKESMAAIARFSQDTGIDGLGMASQFENFGVNIEKTGDHLTEMFKDASKYGISFQSYSDNVVKNIKIAQNYTFRNGLKGLESMAQKATAIKLDMQQVANLADKVSTVEGALETSARLQVLGGPFASMADPMGMLYEGLNDIEGLHDRVAKMVRNLGYFDRATGEIKVSSFDKQRIRAAAEAMGMDYSGLMESVNAQARREEINKQIKASGIAGNFDKDFQELIKNTGIIKDGKAGITINGEFKTLDQLDPKKDRETLIAMTRSESQDIKQIAIDLRSLVQKRSGLGKAYDAVQGRMFSWLGKGESALLGMLGGGLTTAALYGAVGLNNIGILGSLASGWSKLFRGGKSPKLPTGTKLNSAGRLINAKTGRFVSTKATSKAASSGFLKNAFKATPKSLGGGLVLGAAGAAGNYFTDKAIEEGKMKTGSNKHKLAKMASQAATFAGIGSILGVPGMIAGALIGGIVGHQQAQKYKNADILDNQLSTMGITRKGDYGARKLRKIDEALQTGEISDRLRRRLLQEGDTEILNAIEKKKNANELKKQKIKEKNRMRIGTAEISIGVAKFGNLGTTKPLIKGVEEKGYVAAFDKQREKARTTYEENNKPTTFDININGTLRLTGERGQSIDLIHELNHNEGMKRELASMIFNQINANINGKPSNNNIFNV